MPYRRNPARFLAPLALIVAAIAVYTLLTGSDDKPGSTGSVGAQSTTPAKQPSVHSLRRAKDYVVKSGDTLTGIAQKTGLSVAHIQALNTPLDAASLRVGRRLKLRE